MINNQQLKELREQTLAPFQECQKALKEAKGDLKRAKEILRQWGQALADKKTARETKEGIIDVYLHPTKKIGVILELNCETDFVSRSSDFQALAHELCLQIAAMNPENAEALLIQPWIKDQRKQVKELLTEAVAKHGENTAIGRFTRFSI